MTPKPPYAEKFVNGVWLWSNYELLYLKANYKHSDDAVAISEHLQRSPKAIRTMASNIGASKRVRWTANDIRFVRENYKKMSKKELAEELAVTEEQVGYIVKKLKLKKAYTTVNQ